MVSPHWIVLSLLVWAIRVWSCQSRAKEYHWMATRTDWRLKRAGKPENWGTAARRQIRFILSSNLPEWITVTFNEDQDNLKWVAQAGINNRFELGKHDGIYKLWIWDWNRWVWWPLIRYRRITSWSLFYWHSLFTVSLFLYVTVVVQLICYYCLCWHCLWAWWV